MKPIRIYLDTSDYIRMHSSKEDTEFHRLKNMLVGWVEEGAIEIGYSFWIVTEFIKDGEASFQEDRRAKGQLIKILTRGKAFPHPMDLKLGHQFPNDGIWMPRSTFESFSERFTENYLAEKIATDSRFNRKWRRKLSTTSGARQFWKEFGSTKPLEKQDFLPLPVTDEFIKGRYFERFLFGEIQKSELKNAMVRWCSDPEEYFELWNQNLGYKNPIIMLTSSFHEKFSNAIDGLLDATEKLDNSFSIAKKAHRNYEKALRDSSLPKNLLDTLPKPVKPSLDKSRPKLDVAKQFSALVPEKRTEYINEYVDGVLAGRKPEKSDIIDMMHLQYIFDCDLFRCDRKNANLFKNSKNLPSNRIVGRLEDLPDRIIELVKMRSQ